MEIPSESVIEVITFLLPGFLAAYVFYGLTAHRLKSPFERTIEALIFTALVQVAVPGVHTVLSVIGRVIPLGKWTPSIEQGWSLVIALAFGTAFAWIANRDWFHGLLRRYGITSKTSFCSEWFGAFQRAERYVTLHLKGDRRLMGWPEEWPDHPDTGHFVLQDAEWLLLNGETARLHSVERVVIPATDVELVETMLPYDEVKASEAELERVKRLLIDQQRPCIEEEIHPDDADKPGTGERSWKADVSSSNEADSTAPTAPTEE